MHIPMDEELRKAAIDTEGSPSSFLDAAVESNPKAYFKSVYIPASDADEQGGNILHLAAYHNNVGFFTSALHNLGEDDLHSLLCQDDGCPKTKQNPIHVAASRGHERILEVIVDFYSTGKGRSSSRWKRTEEAWAAQDGAMGRTPLHYVLELASQEEIALKIFSILDVDQVCDQVDQQGNGLLFLALKRGFSDAATTIFNCGQHRFSLSGSHGSNAFFFAPRCSDDVCSNLLRVSEFQENLEGEDERSGDTVLHEWVRIGKIFPFEAVLERGWFYPYYRETFLGKLLVANKEGDNPLHIVAKAPYGEATKLRIAKMLVEGFKRERKDQSGEECPWYMTGSEGGRPLRVAIANHSEKLASYFCKLYNSETPKRDYDDDIFFLALENGYPTIAQKWLDLAEKTDNTKLLTLKNGRTALHLAPKCTEDILRQLIENHVKLINESDKWGETILHSWIKIGDLWPLKYILTREDIKPEWRSSFISLLGKHDTEERNPLHLVVASEDITDIEQVVQLLLDAFHKEYPQQPLSLDLPWLDKDIRGHTPLIESIFNKREKLALCFLSWAKGTTLRRLIDIQGLDILFKAIEYNCHQVVNFILEWVYKHNNQSDYLHSSSAGHNILHLAFKCTEENGRLMVERWPELINKTDKDGKTPLERASEMGAAWLVGLILQKDRSCLMKTPLAWVEACKNGHLSTVITFAEKSPYFRYFCYKQHNTPLHNVQGSSYKEYQQFLEHESIKELRNIQNSKGETPLHVAIRSKNKDLSELLLIRDDVDPTIKDNHNKTAMHLLKEICDENEEWSGMCQVIGVDPTLKTTYIQPKTDLTEMRSTISVVAALLATITFTAGFTLPGGLNGDNGESILAKKAAFLVFLLTDTYSMCCSMLILFCIIWSMVCDRNKATLLIDRSLVLLKQSLYGTLLAFMTGVYIVIHQKSLWAAIVIFIMCSLVVIAANRSMLYEVVPRLIPAADYDYYRLVRWLRCWNRKEDKKQLQEATPLNNGSGASPADSIV